MKKILPLLLIFSGIFLSSCNPEEKESALPINSESLQGKWNVKYIINYTDNKNIEYKGKCKSNNDYIEFTAGNNVQFYTYDSDCKPTIESRQYSFATNILINGVKEVNGAITKLTAHEMQIDYREIRDFSKGDFPYSQYITGIILTR